ncbi:hypothetical protein [Paenibacillus sp. NPDC101420]|uniref:hypothetical protein n=1 Tax=Paenibacillus sp. NPDC101420 TaxID=3390602 RepID=UPI003CFDF235
MRKYHVSFIVKGEAIEKEKDVFIDTSYGISSDRMIQIELMEQLNLGAGEFEIVRAIRA